MPSASPSTPCTPRPCTGTRQGTSYLLPDSVLGCTPTPQPWPWQQRLGSSPGHPFGLSKGLESFLLTWAFRCFPPPIRCISGRGGRAAPRGSCPSKGRMGNIRGPLRSTCRLSPRRWQPLHRWELELGAGAMGQDAQTGVLESPLGHTPFPQGGDTAGILQRYPRRREDAPAAPKLLPLNFP